MSYIYLANGRVGYEVLRWLLERDEKPSGLVVHHDKKSKYKKEMLTIAKLPPCDIIEGPELATEAGEEWVAARKPEWLVSVYFGYILKPRILALPSKGAINLHPALLPYNRGACPNVWSIVERTPAGVTLHFIDPGIDTGDIISQREIAVEAVDTGATLHVKLEDAALTLFKETWPQIGTGQFPRKPQVEGGTYHRVADVEAIDRIDPDASMRAGDLLDILRARTFPPHRGAYLDLPDRRVYLKLELTEEKK
jgi:methionyl-tRNA formyltransferase